VIQQSWQLRAKQIVEAIFEAVDMHRQAHAIFDDETVLAVKVN
jgi:serine phosphatase RsbU (regulator of sigma subunit)